MSTPPVGKPTKAVYSQSPRTIARMPTAWEQENVESTGRNLLAIVAVCAIGSLAVIATLVYWLVFA